MAYTGKEGTTVTNFNSQEEHTFSEKTTKRQLYLIVKSLSELLKDDDINWVDYAKEEREALKANGIK